MLQFMQQDALVLDGHPCLRDIFGNPAEPQDFTGVP
jgi:hypothetical protein